MKLYISHWDGSEVRGLEPSFLIPHFVKTLKVKNPDVEIVFISSQSFFNTLDLHTQGELTLMDIGDKFDHFEIKDWALVKLLMMCEIPDKYFIHLDYDIVWNYPVKEVVSYVHKNKIDLLYQRFEQLLLPHNYYFDFVNKYDYMKKMLSQVKDRFAYNAGITFVGVKAKKDFIRHVNNYKLFELSTGAEECAFEQLYIPTIMKLEGYHIDTLLNISKYLKKESPLSYLSDRNVMDFGEYKYMNATGIFISSIGFFHFMGEIKKKENIKQIIEHISGNITYT